MAKKGKFVPGQETITEADVGTVPPIMTAEEVNAATSGNGETKESKPKLPGLFIEDQNGVQFKFIRYALPKRAGKEPDMHLTIDGEQVPAWKTTSEGWAKEGTHLTYVYFKLGEVSGYIVLKSDDSLDGLEFKAGEGDANRANPKAETKFTPEELQERQNKAKTTRETNKNKAPAETPAEQPAQ